MKVITIKPIFKDDTYADMIRNSLNFQPPGKGFTLSQMLLRIKILDKLADVKRSLEFVDIELEDEEAKEVLEAIKSQDGYWAVMDKELVKFIEDVTEQLS